MEAPASSENMTGDDLNEFLEHLVGTLAPIPPTTESKECKTELDSSLNKIETIVGLLNAAVEDRRTSNSSIPLWVESLRNSIKGILTDKRSSCSQKVKCLRIASLCLSLYGWSFPRSDPQFLCLLTELCGVEIRLALDKSPDMIQGESLSTVVSCCSVIEESIITGITRKLDEQFVKHQVSEFSIEWNPNVELSIETEDIPDNFATLISQSSREMVSFLMEFFVKADSYDIKVRDNLGFPLLRLVCSFLAHGGHEIVDNSLLKAAVTVLLKFGEDSSAKEDAKKWLRPALESMPSNMCPKDALKE